MTVSGQPAWWPAWELVIAGMLAAVGSDWKNVNDDRTRFWLISPGVYMWQPHSVYMWQPHSVYMWQPYSVYMWQPHSVYMWQPHSVYMWHPHSVYIWQPHSLYMWQPHSPVSVACAVTSHLHPPATFLAMPQTHSLACSYAIKSLVRINLHQSLCNYVRIYTTIVFKPRFFNIV
jgi:hypothetical protein